MFPATEDSSSCCNTADNCGRQQVTTKQQPAQKKPFLHPRILSNLSKQAKIISRCAFVRLTPRSLGIRGNCATGLLSASLIRRNQSSPLYRVPLDWLCWLVASSCRSRILFFWVRQQSHTIEPSHHASVSALLPTHPPCPALIWPISATRLPGNLHHRIH